MKDYFAHERKDFNIPLLTVGTDFQKSVWEGLIKIPYGTTASYLELSKNIGNEKAVRAVASANGANAISILIPCHRIIGSNGDLVGYAGGLPAKKKLLELENNLFC
jgi:methylated-DNA-[protein]-cysteine S-methyltransferase